MANPIRAALSAAFVLLIVLLTGCASGIKRAEEAAKREAYFAGGGKLAREVTLALNDTARSRLADNPGFDQERLLGTVKRLLDAKGLLAKAPDASLPSIEIVITDIRVRSNFTAVMFGFMAGSDSVAGEVIARDATGKEVQRFEVSASYALGGIAGGQDSTRMDWLYQTFANEMMKELTGASP